MPVVDGDTEKESVAVDDEEVVADVLTPTLTVEDALADELWDEAADSVVDVEIVPDAVALLVPLSENVTVRVIE